MFLSLRENCMVTTFTIVFVAKVIVWCHALPFHLITWSDEEVDVI